jgi:hypothetical protein
MVITCSEVFAASETVRLNGVEVCVIELSRMSPNIDNGSELRNELMNKPMNSSTARHLMPN